MNKPILFNTEMVRAIMDGRKTVMAILDGRKTVTRRVIKPQPTHEQPNSFKGSTMWWGNKMFAPPYSVGDILWVRETFNSDWCDHTIYKADGGSARGAGYSEEPKWHPSIHMPREAARIFLRVTDVRAERLQEISNKDALREGVARHGLYNEECYAGGCYNGDFESSCAECEVPRKGFSKLWDSTVKDADCYGWNANPWVWVISFERCDKPEGFDS